MQNSLSTLIIASRKSPLAMVQSHIIKDALNQLYPELKISILSMTTEGDRKLEGILADKGGKGLFVKELETALLQKKADIAVHSTKDMPIVQPQGLEIHTYFKRHDPRDAFVSNTYDALKTLPAGAVVGTSSLRRQCLLKNLRPDIEIKVLRGNVQTRLRKLDEGEFDAIILAASGLERQNLTHRITEYFSPERFIPAPTQGILCIECRSDDIKTKHLIAPLADPTSTFQAQAERSLNAALQGGCQVPIGAYALSEGNQLTLEAMVGSPDGKTIIRAKASAYQNHACELGETVAMDLKSQGAESILASIYHD